MDQQMNSRTGERLKAYAEALLRVGNAYTPGKTGDSICESVSIARQGNIVLITRHAGATIERALYDMSLPRMIRRNVGRYGIEIEGVMYNSSKLQQWNGQDIQAVRIGNLLYLFDMDGEHIASIEI